MCVCTFIINDVNDLEKDRTNHPDRPLPKNRITVSMAVALYFFFVFLSLLLVKIFVPEKYVYIYLVFLVMLTNYDYVVAEFPYIKNVYVSATAIIPIIVLSYISPGDYNYTHVAGSLALFTLGREIFMDIKDAAGDGDTFSKRIGQHKSFIVAAILQWIGVLTLMFVVTGILDQITVIFLVITLGVVHWRWKKNENWSLLIFFMKIQMLMGLVFLF